ncbi:TPA: hypothetical protein ACLASU_002008, partial [Neisseria meningitidis]
IQTIISLGKPVIVYNRHQPLTTIRYRFLWYVLRYVLPSSSACKDSKGVFLQTALFDMLPGSRTRYRNATGRYTAGKMAAVS